MDILNFISFLHFPDFSGFCVRVTHHFHLFGGGHKIGIDDDDDDDNRNKAIRSIYLTVLLLLFFHSFFRSFILEKKKKQKEWLARQEFFFSLTDYKAVTSTTLYHLIISINISTSGKYIFPSSFCFMSSFFFLSFSWRKEPIF